MSTNETDKFTNEKRLQTEKKWLVRGTDGLSVYFRSVADRYYITLYGYGRGTRIIDETDELILLLDDNTKLTVYPTGFQDYNVRMGGSTYDHQYRISLEEIETLSKHNVTSIRKYSSQGYVDIDIPVKKQDEIKKLALLMLRNI